MLLLQTSASWVLKESRAVYKAASEGVMNLADKYFEMERAQALQGLELYKDHQVGRGLGEHGARAGWVPSVERSYEQKPLVRG